MRRREFIAGLGATVALPLPARAQQTKTAPRIGMLTPGTPERFASLDAAFLQGLHELGYTEGQNFTVERRFGDWKLDRLPELAAELVRLNVDIIVASSTPPARAAKQATSMIPIVVVAMGDPVGDELVASLARPGGNVTGMAFLGPELAAKRLGLLKQIVPGLSRVAALWHPGAYGEHTIGDLLKETELAAQALKLELQLVQASGPGDFDSAFSAMTRERAGAVVVLPSPMLFGEHERIVDLAARSRLPAMYQAREFVDAGGLASYGPNLADLFRRAATYVNKILKGAKPADLPVERPTKFEFVVNLKTAKTLGLDVPPQVQQLADEVIE
jgi:putative ABC transport system substrate-binding protein